MICCKEMMRIMDREGIVKKEGYQINDGRILNEVTRSISSDQRIIPV